MKVLGLSGSPRSDSNSHALLSVFMERAKAHGAQTEILRVIDYDIRPCEEYTVCEKTGRCPIQDDVEKEIYAKLRMADVVVIAAPIFFYNMPAQLKALIDRCQAFWARKYCLHLRDPKSFSRKGVVLSCAATHGNHLFEGLLLTTKYFFDAIDATPSGEVLVRSLEGKGDAERHPTAFTDLRSLCDNVILPMMQRPKWIFYHEKNPQKALIAAAFANQKTQGAISASAFHSGEPLSVSKELQTLLKDQYAMDASSFQTETVSKKMANVLVLMNGDVPKESADIPIFHWEDVEAPSMNEWIKWATQKLETLL